MALLQDNFGKFTAPLSVENSLLEKNQTSEIGKQKDQEPLYVIEVSEQIFRQGKTGRTLDLAS